MFSTSLIFSARYERKETNIVTKGYSNIVVVIIYIIGVYIVIKASKARVMVLVFDSI